jgi:hypothetical protein
MSGGTPWGQAQLRIFDRKFFPALKITRLVFFFLQVMKLFPEILIRVKLIYFSQFYRQYENRDIHVTFFRRRNFFFRRHRNHIFLFSGEVPI